MPKKPLAEPDDTKYHLEVARLDEQIEALQEEFKGLVANKAQMHATQREEQLGKMPIKAKLRELFDELKTYSDERKEKFTQMDAV